LISFVIYWGLLFLLLSGPANRHTANDNTSGVNTLLEIMTALPAESKQDVAFVFFDLEEVGLIGSSAFAARHKAEMKDRLLLNFDCVSDGENMLFALKKRAKSYRDAIEKAFAAKDGFTVEVCDKGVFYPSDQASFHTNAAVSAMNRHKILGLYMDKIHTPRDRVFDTRNIDMLRRGTLALLERLLP
jgi:Zn-dependent M28 family amino/carboxypeptidase